MHDTDTILEGAARDAALRPLVERFGIEPQTVDSYTLRQAGRKYVTIDTGSEPPTSLRIESRGIPFLRVNLPYPKPTTGAIMLFGHLATRNVVDLTHDEARRYVRREDLGMDGASSEATLTKPGYVIVRWGSVTLGLALLLEDGRLKSLYPGRWSPNPSNADAATPGGIGT
ncbi:MAG TPA: hypothetical protein VF190_14960 [Rhodothermales bacterium]